MDERFASGLWFRYTRARVRPGSLDEYPFGDSTFRQEQERASRGDDELLEVLEGLQSVLGRGEFILELREQLQRHFVHAEQHVACVDPERQMREGWMTLPWPVPMGLDRGATFRSGPVARQGGRPCLGRRQRRRRTLLPRTGPGRISAPICGSESSLLPSRPLAARE